MQDAAHELGVAPGAINQRIKTVEERHGLRLFKRNKNGIRLTVAGLALQSDVSATFSVIETAHEKHFSGHGDTVRISASATFSHSMLDQIHAQPSSSSVHATIDLKCPTSIPHV